MKRTIIERFEKYIKKGDECWEWTGKVSPFGYGQFSVAWGDSWQAHRLAYRLYKHKNPGKLCVCHSCDNRKCVNPDHLWLGTRNDNIQDMITKGRMYKRDAERNPAAKLTWLDVNTIRELYKTGRFSHRELGRKFHVEKTTITRLLSKKTWK